MLLFLRRLTLQLVVICCCHSLAVATNSAPHSEEIGYLKSLPLADLLQTEVVSASRRPERLQDLPAAVFVLSRRDIERSGATSVPEALRMVPGIQVARINNNKWAISARGFGDLFADKLQVLVDGRSVYTPLFSGVFWEAEDLVLEDIERIEVIRGVGGVMWGPNTVNGVINIITRDSRETPGSMVTTSVGSEGFSEIVARQGYALDKGDGGVRLYARGTSQQGAELESGGRGYDGYTRLLGGFRTDHNLGNASSIMVKGDVRRMEEEIDLFLPGLLPEDMSREELVYYQASLQGNYRKSWAGGDRTELMAAIVYSEIDATLPDERRLTMDAELQHSIDLLDTHDLMLGAAFRYSRDEIKSTPLLSFQPENDSDHLFSIFGQDDISLVADRLVLTLGARLDHNGLTGFEFQPTARIRYFPDDRQTIWAALSQGVRTPARIDRGMVLETSEREIMPGLKLRNRISGNPEFEAESVVAWEAGYRHRFDSGFQLDGALFYNDYSSLRSFDMGTPLLEADAEGVVVVQDLSIGNSLDATTYGVELWASWKPLPEWELRASYAWLRVHFDGEVDMALQQFQEDDFPEHQAGVQSWFDFGDNWELDGEMYWVDELESRGVDGYLRLDLRLGYRIARDWTLSLSGENLLQEYHREFESTNGIMATDVPRQLMVRLSWNHREK